MTACLALAACKKKIDVNFTFAPIDPRAGQVVSFTNQSSGGEDWEWTFGDGVTSVLKSPTHTYKRPGEYTVTLKVNKKKNLTFSIPISVYDTVPNFCGEADTVGYDVYTDYTFKALVYNPYGQKIQYLWTLPDKDTPYAVVIDTSMTKSTLKLYFTRPDKPATVALRVVIGEKDTTTIEKQYFINDVPTNSVLMRTEEGDKRQRVFGKRAEDPKPDNSATPILNQEQDTFQVYNRDTFSLSLLKIVFPEIEGFHIGSRKLYFRHNGLYVANIDGANIVQIDSMPCHAMTLDNTDNRIYWANDSGVWYMPFIGSDNNKFVTEPVKLNKLGDVSVLATDAQKR